MKAQLILENGTVFEGKAFGYMKETIGEVVFNTSMTGYQEVLTDPSYYGQIVTMTYPLIGNYGINLDDIESDSIKVKGFIVRERCDSPNNFRCEFELDDYLKQNKVMGIEGIDTRALTKMIRNQGTMKGIITVRELTESQIATKFKAFHNTQAVEMVSTKEMVTYEGNGPHIGIMDFGIKNDIVKAFRDRGCQLTIFPAFTKAEELLKHDLDAVFLSNGPGDPKDIISVIEEIKKVIGKKPIEGICLGHQLIALALDGDTEKLKFGHRGGNHPVKNLKTNHIMITSQNHGYVVKGDSLPENVDVTHINLNDGSIEGLKHKELPIYSIQFHPEAGPGPTDTAHIFDEFLNLIKENC
ncbi:carbamoyl-phosphate synthase small subunit [Natranaerovirga hydrolytica]|uniref:Carbamoyl phosphate synthase small chain n=1 Tax=Natranaerovirga hydrolytica TaxID=680378 RepID=A0A4V2Q058_9FIRM|nr:carbamoyl phosphate synthase small subunit [Natranaerovirga hydrolytica]TCK92381.1 carbamoyl-phosphate synthase small subunit [Natranaerovirga hydrolytica]